MSDCISNSCVSSDYLRNQGEEIMSSLLGGNRFRSRRLLLDLSNLKIPFSHLEVAAEGMAAVAPEKLERIFLHLREVVHSALENIGMVLLCTSFYGHIASHYPDRVIEEANLLAVRGRRWWIADLVASRMMLSLLISHPLLGICILEKWGEQDDPWLRRCVAATVNQNFKNPNCDASALVFLLESIRQDTSSEVQRGVSMALRTLCKNHEEVGLSTLKTWAYHADARVATVIRGGMSTLGMVQRQELEAVLAAR